MAVNCTGEVKEVTGTFRKKKKVKSKRLYADVGIKKLLGSQQAVEQGGKM
ncbi:predicted protein [Histoplasma mississippiense (nom. inval.)]|nr:predicted protein [Histoplasma mississippiense (nom. inval.)]EDN10138.1 predicted protein [Histoplasma mississippiense (nom. inval.)]